MLLTSTTSVTIHQTWLHVTCEKIKSVWVQEDLAPVKMLLYMWYKLQRQTPKIIKMFKEIADYRNAVTAVKGTQTFGWISYSTSQCKTQPCYLTFGHNLYIKCFVSGQPGTLWGWRWCQQHDHSKQSEASRAPSPWTDTLSFISDALRCTTFIPLPSPVLFKKEGLTYSLEFPNGYFFTFSHFSVNGSIEY